MRSIAKIAFIAGALSLASTGAAFAEPAAVNIVLSPEFAKTAEKLGEREVQDQLEDFTRQIERTLTRRNALDGAEINLVVTDLQPNRPTFKQLTDRPGLDAMRSLSIGGAAFEGTVTLADGTTQEVKYRYYSPTIMDSVGSTVWTDAWRASNRLANNLARGQYVSR